MSLKLIVLITFFATTFASLSMSGWKRKPSQGNPMDFKQYPFLVGIHLGKTIDYSLCGGTILSVRTILTAASCFDDLDVTAQFYTHAVSAPINIIPLAKIKLHENYSIETMENDIAIVQTAWSIPFGDRIANIPLPSPEFVPDEKSCDVIETMENDIAIVQTAWSIPFGDRIANIPLPSPEFVPDEKSCDVIETMENDIAIVQTAYSIPFGDRIGNIPLPSPEFVPDEKSPSIMFELSFDISPVRVSSVNDHAILVDLEKCKDVWKTEKITEKQLCVVLPDTPCIGYAHGYGMIQPENGQRVVIAVASYTSQNCEDPTVYTNVVKYVSWIHENIAIWKKLNTPK